MNPTKRPHPLWPGKPMRLALALLTLAVLSLLPLISWAVTAETPEAAATAPHAQPQPPATPPQADGASRALQAAAPPPPPQAQPLRARQRDWRFRTLQPMEDVDAHVAALLPYSALANEVYCDALYTVPSSEANQACKSETRAGQTGRDAASYGWRYGMQWPDRLEEPHNFRGMRFAMYWREFDADAVEIGFAFRGTDFESPADWRANLRWFIPGRDQYDVLAEIVPEIIRRSKETILKARADKPPRVWRIVTTGHSLGGGLAQLFAYKSSEVQAAVVFDSSPVTGFHSCVSDAEVNCHVPVWRVYERGEVLSYLRAFTRLFYPLSENITEIEFNLVSGNFIANHSMKSFHDGMLEHAAARPAVDLVQPAPLFARKLDCSCARERKTFSWHLVQDECEALQALRTPTARLQARADFP